jgi:hypothetical protein
MNRKTRATASVLGILLGMGGLFNHGLFEILQGNTPTNGFYIEAIGKSHRYWIHGTEGAFTLIPNFLLTGIFVLLVSTAVIVWSIRFIHIRRGAAVFLFLLIALTLVGGGIGHIALFIPAWAYATRINKPLHWWGKVLSEKIRKPLKKLWLPFLLLTCLSWLIVMELGIFGLFPGLTSPDVILNVCLAFVLITVFLANLTFICGFARDIEERKGGARDAH